MVQELELKSLKKINGEYFLINKVSLKEIKRRREMCVGEMGTIQLKLDNLNFRIGKIKDEINIIDDLLNRKSDFIDGENNNED